MALCTRAQVVSLYTVGSLELSRPSTSSQLRIRRSALLQRQWPRCQAQRSHGRPCAVQEDIRSPGPVSQSENEAAPLATRNVTLGGAAAPAAAAISSLLLQASVFATPALALPAYTDEEWVPVLLTFGAIVGAYLFVAPPLIYTYYNYRWFKKSTVETIIMYFAIFLFFPSLLLWAPFINFRILPRDSSKVP